MFLPACREPRRHGLPLAIVLVHEPVDDLRDAPLDLLRRVGDHLFLELALHARSVHQVEHAAEAQRVVEVPMSPCLHLEQDVLDPAHPQLESPAQVGAILRELPLDVVEGGRVGGEERQPFFRRRRRSGAPSTSATPSGLDSLSRNRLCSSSESCTKRSSASKRLAAHSAGSPCFARLARRALTGKTRRSRAEHASARVADKRQHLLELAGPLEDVDLVDDDHDLLAPGPDRFDEHALRSR